MIYLMRCNVCKKELEISVTASIWQDFIKPGIKCNDGIESGCAGLMTQVITAPHTIINRSPFPGKGNELQLPTKHGEDVEFRDKKEAKEWLGERGLTSGWIENDM